VKEFECKKKHFENQVEELKSKYRKLKGHWNPKRNNSRADRRSSNLKKSNLRNR
jgi:hypothetical protein